MTVPRYIHAYPLAVTLLFLMQFSCLVPCAYAENELGRLFFTPERRQNLDRQRQMNIQTHPEILEDPTLTINGVVTRSSGKRTIWINGIAQNENDLPGEISATPNRKNPAQVVVDTAQAPSTQARVGDTINRNSGKAFGILGDGQVTARRGQ